MQVLIENTGNSPMYYGNTMIPAGESRMVEKRGNARPATVVTGPNLVELMAQFLDRTLSQILPELMAMTNEALDLAESEEQAGKKRKTLIEAIQAERIKRADQKLQDDQVRQAEEARAAAANELLSARVALINQPPDATDEARAAAQAAVDEAQAKVDALTPEKV